MMIASAGACTDYRLSSVGICIRRRLPEIVSSDSAIVVLRCTLPTPATKRWVIRRNAEVVVALRGGLLYLEEA
jgi:hypothetical protein